MKGEISLMPEKEGERKAGSTYRRRKGFLHSLHHARLEKKGA